MGCGGGSHWQRRPEKRCSRVKVHSRSRPEVQGDVVPVPEMCSGIMGDESTRVSWVCLERPLTT